MPRCRLSIPNRHGRHHDQRHAGGRPHFAAGRPSAAARACRRHLRSRRGPKWGRSIETAGAATLGPAGAGYVPAGARWCGSYPPYQTCASRRADPGADHAR
ncbi:hypothetical protein G6F22_020972 [Rhizopus arrhizus]|nr:hypothetical protein G6F22_020972 [Rhizopus arrhizus]